MTLKPLKTEQFHGLDKQETLFYSFESEQALSQMQTAETEENEEEIACTAK